MSKAEQRAVEAYPYFTAENHGDVVKARRAFKKGYEAAQKDHEPIRTHLQDIVEAAKRILSLDGKDADVCEAVQDILVASKSIEWVLYE